MSKEKETIKPEDMHDKVVQYFNEGKRGSFYLNQHWRVLLREKGVYWDYWCCDYEQCTSSECEWYEKAETLVKDNDFNIDGDWEWSED